MPCYYLTEEDIERLNVPADRRRAEEEKRRREEALERLEQQLGSGAARIEKNADGTFRIVGGERPEGMYDSCILATLQKRDSFGFRTAMATAGAGATNFVTIHDGLHGRSTTPP